MFIVYLRNAEAARVAQTLRALHDRRQRRRPHAGGPSAIGAQLGRAGQRRRAAGGMRRRRRRRRSAQSVHGACRAGGGALAGGLTIQADTANNALIIMGPEPLYNNLRAIIDRLDVRRAQVFVEALIVEVAADKAWPSSASSGRSCRASTSSNVQGFGGTNFGAARHRQQHHRRRRSTSARSAQGLNVGILNGTLTIPGLGTITNLAFLARALEQDVGANILSTPTLLTLDNEEARIIVGQNVPFVTGQYATTGVGTSTVQPFQTIERKDIGVLLRVKPQITEGGTVRLLIYQEVSRIESFTHDAGPRAVEARARIVGDRRRPAGGRARRTDPGHASPTAPTACPSWATCRSSAPVPLRRAQAAEDQPADLPQADRRAHRRAGQGADLRALRLHHGRAAAQNRPEYRYFWNDQTVPVLPPAGPDAGQPRRVDARHRDAAGGDPAVRPIRRPAPPFGRRRRRRSDCSTAARWPPSPRRSRRDSLHVRAAPTACSPRARRATRSSCSCGRTRRPTASIEIRRVLQRPLRHARDRRRALRLRARARLQPGRGADGDRWSATSRARTTSRASCRTCRVAEDLLDGTTQAPVIRMINALLLQALRERASDLHFEPYESALGRALPHRRRAARRDRAAARAARGARLAPQDHGEPRHRREAPAAGRPHRAQARRPQRRRARVDAAHRAAASASCCACSTRSAARLDLDALGMAQRHARDRSTR